MTMTPKERHDKWKAVRTPEERKAYYRDRHIKNRDANLVISHRLNRTLPHRYGVLKNVAKKKNLEFTLSFDAYVATVSQPCFYCGGPLPEVGYGLDRINNGAGYVQGNVRPCCHPCNQAKSSFSESQFQEWLLRVYNHYLVRR